MLVSCLLLGQRQLDRCGTLKGLSFERTIGKNSSTIVLEWRTFFQPFFYRRRRRRCRRRRRLPAEAQEQERYPRKKEE